MPGLKKSGYNQNDEDVNNRYMGPGVTTTIGVVCTTDPSCRKT